MSRGEHGIVCFVTTIGRADRNKNAKEVLKQKEKFCSFEITIQKNEEGLFNLIKIEKDK